MSVSAELQKLILDRLKGSEAVDLVVNSRVYDRIDDDEEVDFPYISFGPSDQVEDDADCIDGLTVTTQIDCWSRYTGGYKEVHGIVDAVRSALHKFEGELSQNALVDMRVRMVRVFRDPDGKTSHGVVTVETMVELNDG